MKKFNVEIANNLLSKNETLDTNLETYLETSTKVSSSFQLITWMCQQGVLYQEDWIYGSETYNDRYNHIWEI